MSSIIKKVGKVFKKAFKGIVKVVKAIWPILLIAAIVFFTGPAGAGWWGAAGTTSSGAGGALAAGTGSSITAVGSGVGPLGVAAGSAEAARTRSRPGWCPA